MGNVKDVQGGDAHTGTGKPPQIQPGLSTLLIHLTSLESTTKSSYASLTHMSGCHPFLHFRGSQNRHQRRRLFRGEVRTTTVFNCSNSWELRSCSTRKCSPRNATCSCRPLIFSWASANCTDAKSSLSSGGSPSMTTYTRCLRPLGFRLVSSSPVAIRRSKVERDTPSSRHASAFVSNLTPFLRSLPGISTMSACVIPDTPITSRNRRRLSLGLFPTPS